MMAKKCIQGRACSGTCISKNKECLVEASYSSKQLANSHQDLVSSAVPTFNTNNVIAQGNYGKVTLSDDGKAVKKELLTEREGNEWGTMEVELGIKMGEAGYGPKVYPHLTNDTQIVMDASKGKPIWEGYRPAEGEPEAMSEAAGRKALDALMYMHRDLGAYHNDAHAQQFLVDGDNVDLIDFGLSGKIEGDDGWAKATTDLRKSRKFIGLDRFQEDEGIVGEVAKLLTQDAEIKGSSKAAKAAKALTAQRYKELMTNGK